ncbi:hypothetical protein [Paracoccus sp. (in: a-proteobacteria)]|uniref:hypothetical protein n=1 Tax=Paracoccus sp. TaxID=267 RepID=UPI003A8697B1
MGMGQSLASFAEGFAGSRTARKDREEREAMRELNRRMLDIVETRASGGAGLGAMPDPAPTAVQAGPAPAESGSLVSLIDAREGAGDYDTLYGHSQKDGPFAGRSVSQGSIADAIAFADPSGDYAQWVKGQAGRVATPMGRYQIVGSTLRGAADQMGLDPSTPFNKTTQDAMFRHLATNRLRGARDMAGKMAGLRAEWDGFRNVPDDQLSVAIGDFERRYMGGGLGARPPVR